MNIKTRIKNLERNIHSKGLAIKRYFICYRDLKKDEVVVKENGKIYFVGNHKQFEAYRTSFKDGMLIILNIPDKYGEWG